MGAVAARADVSVLDHAAGFPSLAGKYRFTYEEVMLPGNESMGLLGGNYLLGRNEGSYLGLGIYGAVTGDRGGFFVGGVEAGYAYCWQWGWCADTGFYLGGGGGGAAPQGGGLMLRPHLEARYASSLWGGLWGLGMSEIRFPNGDIQHRQFYLSFERAFQTLMLPGWHEPSVLGGFVPDSRQLQVAPRSVYIQAMNYLPSQGQSGRSGKALDDTINVLGIRWREHRGTRWSWDFETSGAFGGQVDGLAQVFAGGSTNWCRVEQLTCHVTAMLGSAGGGDVHTGGGILGRLMLGAEYALNKRWLGMVEVGQTSALHAPFNAMTLNLALGYRYHTLVPGLGEGFEWQRSGHWQKNRIRAGQQSYFAPASRLRKQGQGGDQVDLLTLKLDSFLTTRVYVTGQAMGAYRGDAGGYAVGLIGAGWHQPWQNEYFMEAELAAGAGGGGGLAVGSGALVQPAISIGKRLNRQLSLAAGIAQVHAPEGEMSAQVLDISVNYRFSVPHLAP